MAVAKAAIDSGVARKEITDWDAYQIELEGRMGRDNKLLRAIRNKARTGSLKTIAFSCGEHINTLKAAAHLAQDNIAHPIVLGDREDILRKLQKNNIDLDEKFILDLKSPATDEKKARYAEALYAKLNRKGMSLEDAHKKMTKRSWFALMMAQCGEADAVISQYGRRYTEALEPARQIFQGINRTDLAAMVIVMTKKGPMFFADMAVNVQPTSSQLVNITLLTTRMVKKLGIEPVAAMLSYSNFGTDSEKDATTVSDAVQTLHDKYPELIVDGEIKVDFALDDKARIAKFPFTKLGDKTVNTFIFPNLDSANISYKLVEEFAEAQIIGPILLGLNGAPGFHLATDNASVDSIINLATIAAINVDCFGSDVCVTGAE